MNTRAHTLELVSPELQSPGNFETVYFFLDCNPQTSAGGG